MPTYRFVLTCNPLFSKGLTHTINLRRAYSKIICLLDKLEENVWTTVQRTSFFIFEMAAMPFLCNGILLIQCNLPRVLSVLVLKIANCLIPYIDSFLILNGELSSFLFKGFPK